MTQALALLAAAVLLCAAWMVTHLALLWVTVRSDVAPLWKWLALVPVLTPVAAWIAKARVGAVVWTVLLVSYVVLRLVAG
jgi:hypothetical protein